MRLGVMQRRCLCAAAAAVLATGAGWLLLHYGFPADADVESVGRPGERTLLALHGAAAMAALSAFGTLLAAHVPTGLRRARNRRTGLALLAGVALLAVTGHALYYCGDEAWRPWIAALHWSVGLALLPGFLAHRGRRDPAIGRAVRRADSAAAAPRPRRR